MCNLITKREVWDYANSACSDHFAYHAVTSDGHLIRNVRKRTLWHMHLCSLIWVSFVRMKNICILGYQNCAQWFWSDLSESSLDECVWRYISWHCGLFLACIREVMKQWNLTTKKKKKKKKKKQEKKKKKKNTKKEEKKKKIQKKKKKKKKNNNKKKQQQNTKHFDPSLAEPGYVLLFYTKQIHISWLLIWICSVCH